MLSILAIVVHIRNMHSLLLQMLKQALNFHIMARKEVKGADE